MFAMVVRPSDPAGHLLQGLEKVNMVVRAETEGPGARAEAARSIARIEIHHELEPVQAIWRELESPREFSTPYQRFDFLSAWQRHLGARQNDLPYIIVGYDHAGTPVMVMPLILSRLWGARIAHFMGGKHAAFNMPLWRRSFAERADEDQVRALFRMLKTSDLRPDVYAFAQQPGEWRGLRNPFATLPRQSNPNACPRIILTPNAKPNERISASTRHRLRGKERKLQALPGYRYHIARTRADVTRLLDAFFRDKRKRMALQHLPNVFSMPGVEEFVREICANGIDSGEPLVRLHALECDEEVIAVFSGMADEHRFSMMFNTYTLSGNARYSPGLILIRHIIDEYAAAGHFALDLGVGDADYKTMFCKDNEPLFDTFLPMTNRGTVVAAALAIRGHAVGWVKRRPWLFHIAQRFRRAAA
jgi:CelD/BcsL family acetyltransferase involved in cellulose biosynthesis